MRADMNESILDLSALSRCQEKFRQQREDSSAQPLAKTLAKLEQWTKPITLNWHAPSKARFEMAISQARHGGTGSLSVRQRRVLAYHLSEFIHDEETLLSQLLDRWEDDAKKNAVHRLHVGGLFHSYMTLPQGTWQKRLRHIVRSTFKSMPSLSKGLKEHEHLLTDTPCRPYIEQMIKKETKLLDDLCKKLPISPASWFWQEITEQFCKEIASSKEDDFNPHIEWFLDLEKKIPVEEHRQNLLKTVLEKYAKGSRSSEICQALMQHALDRWGSPQLEKNRKWNTCAPEVRPMVCKWLAQDDLKDFYDLCGDNKQMDKQRLEFWLRFKNKMTFTKIFVCKEVRSSEDPDIRNFLEKKKERLGDLDDSKQNAIFMRIGDWLFIEFTQKNTAARAFVGKNEHHLADAREHRLHDLRKIGKQWIHHDLRKIGKQSIHHRNWQDTFLEQLREKNIEPDDSELDWLENLKLENPRLEITDHRPDGGYLWVHLPPNIHLTPNTKGLGKELEARGFSYNAGNYQKP